MRDNSGVLAMGKELQHKARQTWVTDSGSPMGVEPFSFTVVEAVDDDLYEVPPETLCNKSIRRVCNFLSTRMIVCTSASSCLQHKKLH
jgi:hypothetical protein